MKYSRLKNCIPWSAYFDWEKKEKEICANPSLIKILLFMVCYIPMLLPVMIFVHTNNLLSLTIHIIAFFIASVIYYYLVEVYNIIILRKKLYEFMVENNLKFRAPLPEYCWKNSFGNIVERQKWKTTVSLLSKENERLTKMYYEQKSK